VKKALLMALMPVISVAFVTAVFAQAPAGKPATTASQKAHASAPEKKSATEKKGHWKKGPKTHRYTGNVTKVDTMRESMVVRGKKDQMTFDVSVAQMKGDVHEGDKVTVKYTKKDGQMLASSVIKPGEEKEMQKQMAPGAKPIKRASAKK
jgi:lipopolysaccharide export LptBFGC system permease protein LptF